MESDIRFKCFPKDCSNSVTKWTINMLLVWSKKLLLCNRRRKALNLQITKDTKTITKGHDIKNEKYIYEKITFKGLP